MIYMVERWSWNDGSVRAWPQFPIWTVEPLVFTKQDLLDGRDFMKNQKFAAAYTNMMSDETMAALDSRFLREIEELMKACGGASR